MDSVVLIIIAIIAAGGTSLVTGLLTRPKTAAEAGASRAGGEVAISDSARAWAEQFREEATLAREQAAAAEQRVDQLETKFWLLAGYTRRLQLWAVHPEGQPPSPPPELIPPLSAVI